MFRFATDNIETLYSHSGAPEDVVPLECDAVCVTEWYQTIRRTEVSSWRWSSWLAPLYFFLQSNFVSIAKLQFFTESFSIPQGYPPSPPGSPRASPLGSPLQMKCVRIKLLAAKVTKLYNLKLYQNYIHWGSKGSWGCLRTWCWGEYLDRGGTR